MENLTHIVKGLAGQIEVYDDKIVITRNGLRATLIHRNTATKEIPKSNIAGIQFREPSLTMRGYIRFEQRGQSANDDGIFNAATDENSVMFTKKQRDAFAKIKDEIEKFYIR